MRNRVVLNSLNRDVEMFYMNTIEQLFLFIEQLNQLEVCLPHEVNIQE